MTRGKILFIKDNREISCTTEFNGDMYPSGNGGEVLERFEEGYFSDFIRFKRFVENFNRRNYGYEEELIQNLHPSDYVINIQDNLTDYLYIINETEKQWTIVDKDKNTFVLPEHSLAVVYFEEVERTIHRTPQQNKNNDQRKLSKEEFCSILERLKEARDLVDKVGDLFNKSRENIENDFVNGTSLQISHESTVEEMMDINNNLEKEADKFATNYLIPPADYKKLAPSKYTSDNEIVEFAKSIGIHPGIVAGRIQHEGIIAQNRCSKLKEKYVIEIKHTA